MNTHKTDWSGMSTPTLLNRRRRLVARLGDAETLLAGSLVEQTRRCGKAGCRCAEGEPHGPYVYFAPKTAGRGRLRYVPAALVEVVRRCVHAGVEVEAVLAEISTINAELLARRELR
jgi:Family of unknown function (DUF6788)